MTTPTLHTDCQLLDALEKHQAPADPQSLAARLTQLCEEQALVATPEQIAQAAAEVAEQPVGVTPVVAFTEWKRPSATDWVAIQADLAWVERLWARTFRNMQWGVGGVVLLNVAGVVALRCLPHDPLIRPNTPVFDEIVVGLILVALSSAVGSLVQALAQGGLSAIREGLRLRKWARQLGRSVEGLKYVLKVASPNPKALARWKKSPTARRHLKNLMTQSVPLLALDTQELEEQVEWETYQRSAAKRQAEWNQGLHELAVEP